MGRLRIWLSGALVVALGFGLAGCGGGSQGTPPPLTGAPGRIIGYDGSTGALALEQPSGAGRSVQPGTLQGDPSVSPDGKFIVTDSGDNLLAVTATGVRRLSSPVAAVSSDDTVPAQPFADHDHLILAPRAGTNNAPVRAVPVRGKGSQTLGRSYDASGDPGADAAYLTIAAGQPVPDVQNSSVLLQPEVKIERVVYRRPARTIITAAKLDALAGLPPGTDLQMSATPSPNGDEVLVSAYSFNVPNRRGVLAVLEPNGRMIADVAGFDLEGGFWSPDSARIAYFNTGKHQVMIWNPATKSAAPITVPAEPSFWYDCVWYPTGTWLACAGGQSPINGDPTTRLLVDIRDARADITRSSDQPVVWARQ